MESAGSDNVQAVDQPRLLNRELSWLDFNTRVLELAGDPTKPVLERVSFLAIFASNLDEFFMKRVGGLQRQLAAKQAKLSPDGLTAREQLDAIHAKIRPLLRQANECWFEDLHPALKKQGVSVRRYADLTPSQRAEADAFFAKQVFPILTPLAVDIGHPFPFISNLSKSMGVMLKGPDGTPSFVRVKLPENLPRWVPVTPNPEASDVDGELALRRTFVPLEGVIGANLEQLFHGMTVVEHHLFRVTRNADVEMDEEDADDLLAMVEQELRKRRMAGVVRLELPMAMDPAMRKMIVDGLGTAEEDIYTLPGPIDMDDLFQLIDIDRPDLKFDPWTPTTPPRFADEDANIFDVISRGDVLVHHPYEDFADSVERFILEAADDPSVLAIKMTLYRTSRGSNFVPALIRAAEQGKQVAVLVEIKARFDEERNVQIAQALEKAGVHVVYGFVGLKTHTKTAMVVREESGGPKVYAHIGTGNYNARTAELYTDLGLFTADPDICTDITNLFHHLTGRSLKRDYAKLLIAPVNMRDRFVELIRFEAEQAKAGKPGRIRAKMNQLQDKGLIKELYAASRAGVKIDLIVRGFCCLRPGVPGLSDNIRVKSILGRFLEHSRVYHFHHAGDQQYFIGSADWMSRNLDWRVEAITPVESTLLQARLDELLSQQIADEHHSWNLAADGTWSRNSTPEQRAAAQDSQQIAMAQQLERVKEAALSC